MIELLTALAFPEELILSVVGRTNKLSPITSTFLSEFVIPIPTLPVTSNLPSILALPFNIVLPIISNFSIGLVLPIPTLPSP